MGCRCCGVVVEEMDKAETRDRTWSLFFPDRERLEQIHIAHTKMHLSLFFLCNNYFDRGGKDITIHVPKHIQTQDAAKCICQ